VSSDALVACLVADVTECTLVDFVGFVVVVVSLLGIGEILSNSIVHPSALETVCPQLPPKTRCVLCK
jgi:hypothetical protein